MGYHPAGVMPADAALGESGQHRERRGRCLGGPLSATSDARRRWAADRNGRPLVSTLDLARFQFGWTSVNHFFFVPVTIGLAFLTALLQTWWYRNKNADLLRLTRFFGTLLLISVAVGVVTGLVQEFEFGMNWGAYSRLVGNVFGAPLAMEGLAAFFLESTFLGLWVFGWDRLPRKVHLACIWLVALGSMLSAPFILAANSWMQHPVGYTINQTTHEPQLNNILAAIPDLLSLLATNSFKGKVVGLNQLQQQYAQKYGPGNYIPNVFIQYWSMRVMAYLAAGLFGLALWGGWLLHRKKLERSRWFLRL